MFKFKKNLICFFLIFIVFPFSFVNSEGNKENQEAKIKAIRKVLIVSEGKLKEGIEKAKKLGIPEVAEGIPPALKEKITEDMLPYIYEEKIYDEEESLPEDIEKALKEKGENISQYYPTLDENIESGDVVSILDKGGLIFTENTKYLIGKSTQPYDQKVLGVISENSVVTINGGGNKPEPEKKVYLRQVALTGQVLVKVSTENGEIKIGDYLTSSSIPGVAMKAKRAGKTIGMALENFSGSNGEIGKIKMFVNVDWYGGELEETSSFSGIFSNLFNWILEEFKKIGIFVQENLIKAKRIIASNLIIEKKSPIPEENSIGEGVILSGTREVVIYNNNVKPTSKIFVTFREDYGGRWWASEISEGYFKISLSDIALKDIPFDYWIVGVGEQFFDGDLILSSQEPPSQEPPTNQESILKEKTDSPMIDQTRTEEINQIEEINQEELPN